MKNYRCNMHEGSRVFGLFMIYANCVSSYMLVCKGDDGAPGPGGHPHIDFPSFGSPVRSGHYIN
jgi:hypothetical protein